jgi:hypothetical protein
MSLQFHLAIESMDVWSASGADISFVITFASPTGSGLRGPHGFLASWRPLYSRTGAVKVIGSPFNSFEEAEQACNAMLGMLEEQALMPHLLRQGIEGRIAASSCHVGECTSSPERRTQLVNDAVDHKSQELIAWETGIGLRYRRNKRLGQVKFGV